MSGKYDEKRLRDLLEQIEALKIENEKLRQGKKRSPLNDPTYRNKCIALRIKYKKLAIQDGVTLGHIVNATDKPVKVYKNPITGQTWCSRGKMPNWLKGHLEEYLVKTSGKS